MKFYLENLKKLLVDSKFKCVQLKNVKCFFFDAHRIFKIQQIFTI